MSHHLGVIGLATMGANLARNAARNGARVVVYNRTAEKTNAFLQVHRGEGEFVGTSSLTELCAALPAPRAILIMVKAGEAVDGVLQELVPHLSTGDIVIDGGNSHYRDTERRTKALRESSASIHFIGLGVSGGEEGALHGPSMMAGGNAEAYARIEPLLRSMAADDGEGGKCVALFGPGGAGHFVKTVHNGIEYGVMQVIAEAAEILRSIGGYEPTQLADTFDAWNRMPEMQSFLLEITARIFRARDTSGAPLVDLVADRAAQKGTGTWTLEAAHRYGVAIPTIAAAVDARVLSSDVSARETGKQFPTAFDLRDPPPRPQQLRTIARSGMELSTIAAYLQGFGLLHHASEAEGWKMDLGEVARVWSGGCIIRSSVLRKIRTTFATDSIEAVIETFAGEQQAQWRWTVSLAAAHGIPAPAMSASLAFYDALRRERLPQYLIQAQRDAFGAHGYERMDTGGVFHGGWETTSE